MPRSSCRKFSKTPYAWKLNPNEKDKFNWTVELSTIDSFIREHAKEINMTLLDIAPLEHRADGHPGTISAHGPDCLHHCEDEMNWPAHCLFHDIVQNNLLWLNDLYSYN